MSVASQQSPGVFQVEHHAGWHAAWDRSSLTVEPHSRASKESQSIDLAGIESCEFKLCSDNEALTSKSATFKTCCVWMLCVNAVWMQWVYPQITNHKLQTNRQTNQTTTIAAHAPRGTEVLTLDTDL